MAEKTYTLNRQVVFALNHRKYLIDSVDSLKDEVDFQLTELGKVIEELTLEKFELLTEIEELKSDKRELFSRLEGIKSKIATLSK